MNATVSLEGILQMLQPLSADSKRWLGERLIEDAREETSAPRQSYAEFIESLCGAWSDDRRTTEEITNDIRQARQFGVTRHIMPLTDEEK